MSDRPNISVIVPCYNDESAIAACIESLLNQEYPAHEIIIVDDVSKDKTADVAASFANVKVVRRTQNGGAGAARNEGALKATGDIVAFTDADCVAPTHWLKQIATHFINDPALGGVGGRYLHGRQKTFQGRMSAHEEEYAHFIFSKHPNDAIPPGGNCAYQRTAWTTGRSWRELYYFRGMGSGEDSLVGHEIKSHATVKFDYEIGVTHNAKEYGGYFKRHLNRGYSRSCIVRSSLTSAKESKLAFAAYGGWRLFLGSLCLIPALLAFVAASALSIGLPQDTTEITCLALGSIFLFLHAILTWKYFSFTSKIDKAQDYGILKGSLGRLLFRPMLTLRSVCWILGTLLGIAKSTKAAAAQKLNIVLSILHFWRPGRISKLFYFVTSACNARCGFCFNLENVVNWQFRRPLELKLEEIEKIAKNFKRLPYLTLSGGEPFIRPDLPDVIHAFYKYAKTQWVTIPSNAALTGQTLRSTLEILNKCPGMFLTIQVSIDSLHEDHDKSRVIKDGFKKMSATLKALGEIRKNYSNLRIQIATCYDNFNLHRINEIVAYCQEHFEYDQQMFYLIRDSHTLITESNNALIRPYIELLHKNEQVEWAKARKAWWHRAVRTLQALVYRDIVRIKLEKAYLRPCTATQKFVTLWDDGKVSPCEILEEKLLGNIKDFDYDFYKLKLKQHINDLHRREIVEKKCNCDWMCAPPINMLYDFSTVRSIAAGLIRPAEIIEALPHARSDEPKT